MWSYVVDLFTLTLELSSSVRGVSGDRWPVEGSSSRMWAEERASGQRAGAGHTGETRT